MKKLIVIIAIIIASMATAFGQTENDTIVNDTVVSFEIRNIIGQTVHIGEGKWPLLNITFDKQLEKYNMDLKSGIYYITETYLSGKEEEFKVIVK